MEKLDISYVPIDSIKPYEMNAKQHPKEQVEQIKRSITDYGMRDPIGVWNGVIVEGHGRYMACKELGIDQVPIIRLDDMTDEQRKEYTLVHNKTTMNSDFDFDTLEKELESLSDFDAEFYDFDFESLEEEDQEIVEDEAPEVPDEPRVKLGDVWQLGNHRLICGNSTDVAVIDRLMDGEKAHLLLTDPPYGIDYGGMLKGKGDGKGGADKNGWKSYDAPTWDAERPNKSAFLRMITLAEQSIIWGGNYFADILPPKMCWLVWDKGQRSFSLADGELAWTSFDKALRIKTYSRASANREEKVHPTQKPIELLRWCIEDIAERNMERVDTILDIFGGSGSTLIACEQLNRKCYMAELSPEYCDVIIERWENFTGQEAKLISR